MGAGLFSGEPTGDPNGVPCDPMQWSEDSRRSGVFEFAPQPYRDKAFTCWRCRAPDVFTAFEQKQMFEVRKAYIWQQRILCQACYKERIALEGEARECRRRWAAERAELIRDAAFLQR